MKAFFFLITFCISAACLAQSPGGLSGRILNAAKQPVADAVVTILDNRGNAVKNATTDEEGRYKINAVRSGNYNIRIAERYHEVKMLPQFPVYTNKYTILDITLTEPETDVAQNEEVEMNSDGRKYHYYYHSEKIRQ